MKLEETHRYTGASTLLLLQCASREGGNNGWSCALSLSLSPELHVDFEVITRAFSCLPKHFLLRSTNYA